MAIIVSTAATTGRFIGTFLNNVGSEPDITSMVRHLGKNFFNSLDHTLKEMGWTRAGAVFWGVSIVVITAVSVFGLWWLGTKLFAYLNKPPSVEEPSAESTLDAAWETLQSMYDKEDVTSTELNTALKNLLTHTDYDESKNQNLILQANEKVAVLGAEEQAQKEADAWEAVTQAPIEGKADKIEAYIEVVGGSSKLSQAQILRITQIETAIARHELEQRIQVAKDALTEVKNQIDDTYGETEDVDELEQMATRLNENLQTYVNTCENEPANIVLLEESHTLIDDVYYKIALVQLQGVLDEINDTNNKDKFAELCQCLDSFAQQIGEVSLDDFQDQILKKAYGHIHNVFKDDNEFIDALDVETADAGSVTSLLGFRTRHQLYKTYDNLDPTGLNEELATLLATQETRFTEAQQLIYQIRYHLALKHLDQVLPYGGPALELAKQRYIETCAALDQEPDANKLYEVAVKQLDEAILNGADEPANLETAKSEYIQACEASGNEPDAKKLRTAQAVLGVSTPNRPTETKESQDLESTISPEESTE